MIWMVLPILYAVIALILIGAFFLGALNSLIVGAGLFVMGLVLTQNGVRGISISDNKALPAIMTLVGVGLGVWGANVVAPGIIPLSIASSVGATTTPAFNIADVPGWLQLTLVGLFVYAGVSRKREIQKSIKQIKKGFL